MTQVLCPTLQGLHTPDTPLVFFLSAVLRLGPGSQGKTSHMHVCVYEHANHALAFCVLSANSAPILRE